MPTAPTQLGLFTAAVLTIGVATHRSHASELAGPHAPGPRDTSHVAITKPSREVRLGGARIGRIARILVTPGAHVEAGRVLFELDNEVERLEYERLKLSATSTAAVELAGARLDRAMAEAGRVAELRKREIASGARRDETSAELRIAEAELTRAREQIHLLALQADQALASYELLRVRSPFAGRIESVLHDVGESVDHLDPVLELVALDPLFVEFPCPLEEIGDWQPGTKVEVCGDDGDDGATAHVVYCGRRSDVASQTVTVRIELSNADGRWLSGRRVRVQRINEKKGN